MKVSLNIYRDTNLIDSKRQNKNISMGGRLPNFVKINGKRINLGNETSFNTKVKSQILSTFQNKDLASMLSNVIQNREQHYLPKNTIDFFVMFDGALENIKDKKIKNYINKELKSIAKNCFVNGAIRDEVKTGIKLTDLINLADAYNTLKGNYSRLFKSDFWDFTEIRLEPSLPKGYLNYLKGMSKMYKDFNAEISSYLGNKRKSAFWHPVKDFANIGKFDPLADFGHSKNKEIEDYIFQKYYLKNKSLSLPYKKILSEIYKTYGVKVIASDLTKDNIYTLKMIENEFKIWKKHSNGNAKFPPTLILTSIDENFINGTSMAYVDTYGNLHLNDNYDLGTLSSTLRHEMMHLNEQKQPVLTDYTRDKNLSKLINSIIKSKTIETEYGTETVLDFDKCKYREEFLKAGIAPKHIKYAYTNKGEFLAVISEGDISRCSNKFKQDLIKIDLPEYMLDMPCPRNFELMANADQVEKIMQQHPDAKTFDSILKYFE